ncbi:hypothetical protein DL96DRAFT_815350 [Flagelloscypha sp. PMI_526]|nr:hypothetical protein DL96DRAFT_815350 [Flagelloscypha sp. PMI_526]
MPAVSFTSSCVQCESLGEKCDGAPGRGSCTACRTSAKGGAKCSHNPGRPPNAFIPLRLSYVRSLPTDAKARRQALSSKGAATAWKELSRKERLHWHEEAELKKEEHSRLYPEYSYTPTTKAMKAARHGNFGPARVVRKKGRRLDVEDDYERHIEQRHVSLSPSPLCTRMSWAVSYLPSCCARPIANAYSHPL